MRPKKKKKRGPHALKTTGVASSGQNRQRPSLGHGKRQGKGPERQVEWEKSERPGAGVHLQKRGGGRSRNPLTVVCETVKGGKRG